MGVEVMIVIWMCGLLTGWMIGGEAAKRKARDHINRLRKDLIDATQVIEDAVPVMEESGEEGVWFGKARFFRRIYSTTTPNPTNTP